LNIICGLEEATSGNVTIPARIKLGYLPQEANPRPLPTVLEECVSGALAIANLKRDLDESLAAISSNPNDGDAILRYADAESAFSLAGGYEIDARAQEILAGLGFAPAVVAASPLNLSG